jgi:hypothetical protein
MNKLKKWVYIPLGILVGGLALIILLTVLGTKIGFLWALLIESVLVAVIAFVVASKFGQQVGQKITSGTIIALVCVWGIVGMANVGAWLIGSGSDNAPMAVRTHSDIEVSVNAQGILMNYLKSPTTAKFPSSMGDVVVERFPNHFKVTSYVDAQNSFGVPIRSLWVVSFQYADNDILDVYFVSLDGETLFKRDIPNNL